MTARPTAPFPTAALVVLAALVGALVEIGPESSESTRQQLDSAAEIVASTRSTALPALRSSTTTTSPPTSSSQPIRSIESSAPATSGSTATRSAPTQLTPTSPPPITLAPWGEEIPAFADRGACTPEIAALISTRFAEAGATRDTQRWALWVASRETGCDTSKRNQNARTRDDSFGWCQANALAGIFAPGEVLGAFDRHLMLVDWEHATAACVAFWKVCGRGPWAGPGRYYCRPPADLN